MRGFIDNQIEAKACVPIAIHNALTWTGQRPDFHEVRERSMHLGFDPKKGVNGTTKQLAGMFLNFGLRICQIDPKVQEIEKALDEGYGVLISYLWQMPKQRPLRKIGAHTIFISGHEGNFFKAYNVNGNGAEYKPIMKKFLKHAEVWRVKKDCLFEDFR